MPLRTVVGAVADSPLLAPAAAVNANAAASNACADASNACAAASNGYAAAAVSSCSQDSVGADNFLFSSSERKIIFESSINYLIKENIYGCTGVQFLHCPILCW